MKVKPSYQVHAPVGQVAKCVQYEPLGRYRGAEPLFFLLQIPLCKVIRFNIDYTIHFIEEMMPEVREKIV